MSSLLLIAIVLNAAPPPEAAPPAPTDDELRALEEALGADDDAEEASDSEPSVAQSIISTLNPDIAFILDLALAWFSDDPDQSGAHDPSRNGFNLQQLELHVVSNVDPFFRFESNIVFGQFGVEVEEAYVTTLALPAGLQLRAGQFLTRIGRINASHPHSWHFTTQPLVIGEMLGGEGSRGLGAEVSWLTPLPWYVELVASAGDAAGECCARSFYGGDDRGVDGPEDLLYTIALKQFFALSQDWSLSWGLSAQLGPNASGRDNRTAIYASDLYLRWRPLESAGRTSVDLTVEGFLRAREVPRDQLTDWGMYSSLVWLIDANWELGVRHDLLSGVEDDPLDPDFDGDRHRLTLQGTFYPSHFSRLRLEGAWDRAERAEESIWSLMLALEVVIGAHGAHSY